MKCPNCQFENKDNAKFCKSCGYKLADINPQFSAAPESTAATILCPACGAVLKPGAKFCAKCGTQIGAAPDTEIVSPFDATSGMSFPPYPGDATIADINTTGGGSLFGDSTMNNDTLFGNSTVGGGPLFGDSTVGGGPLFGDSTVGGGPLFGDSTVGGGPLFGDSTVGGGPLFGDSTVNGGSAFTNTAAGDMPLYSNNNTVFDSTMESTLYSEATLFNNPPVPDPIPIPPAPAPDTMPPSGSPAFCKQCGAPLKPGAKFCSKCGAVMGKQGQAPDPIPKPPIRYEPAPVKPKDDSPGKQQPSDKKKVSPLIIVLLVLLVLLLLAVGFFALVKTGVIDFGSSGSTAEDNSADEGEESDVTAEETEAAETEESGTAEAEESEDNLAELEEKLAPIADQVSAAEEKLNSEDYGGADADLTEALNAYAALASEYPSETAIDAINAPADSAFALYTTSVLKQVEGWESQSVTAPLYQQIDITLQGATDFAAQLKESNLAVNTDALDQNYAEFPDRYKEKYILTFNDLRTGDEWSRTTAWQYMQDAASVGLVDKENMNDPLTLRYAYALAWITQRDISEGMKDGSVTAESAISSILSLAESIDYNPVLMRDLALYYDTIGDSDRSKIMQTACTDVYNYLANTENVYLNGEELFVPGRNSSNASSTISLNDFWYFNDFGEYAPSNSNNGVSPEGREYIRNIYKEAINAL